MKPLLLIFFAQALLAQTPRISNAKVETRSGSNLEAVFKGILAAQAGPLWVAYTIPTTAGHESCCWSDNYRGCALEGQNRSAGVTTGPVMLEGSTTLVVLYRIADHAVDKTRSVSGDCELDGGGLPFILLTGVRPAESVAMLESTVTEKKTQNLFMIALHEDPAAYASLKRFAMQNPSENIREKTMFALTVTKDPDAVNTLITAAKNDKSTKVRGQALFWLAHKAGQRETAAIVSSVDNDPDLAVKKRALFALTQIPKDEGVPKLIEVARTNRTPEVRKQAMFWLGQSKDPRAIAFFQEILTK